VWEKYYPSHNARLGSYLYVAEIATGFDAVRFGDEGQQWAIMGVNEFLDHPKVVDFLKLRLRDYLNGCAK